MLESTKNTIKTNFTFGIPIAENDPYLLDAYIDNGAYESMKSRTDSRCFLIGRTGTGKSAVLRRIEHEYPAKVIRIAPENLAMAYITNLNIMPQLISLGVHLEPFLKALWKHVFIVEILRRRYNLTGPEDKTRLINRWMERFRKDPAKVESIRYLNELGDKFWCETHERVKQVAYIFEEKLRASGGLNANAGALGAKGTSDLERTERQELQSEQAANYQRIVNEVQIPRLNTMMELLDDEILDEQHFTYIVIDDLDKDWIDEQFVNLLIRCLFQAVIDMKRVKHLKILVALRTNIFRQLNYGAQKRGAQEEKIQSFTLTLQWDNRSLRRLLARRAEVASQDLGISPPMTLDDILPKVGKRAPDPIKYILSRTLLRPRDAILFLNKCLEAAIGKESLTMEDIYRAEMRYSEERLTALRDEWKDPYIGIEKVFEQFRRYPARFSRGLLTQALEKVAVLPAERAFQGGAWLDPLTSDIWTASDPPNPWMAYWEPLTQLLYTLGFIGIVRGKDAIYSYEDTEYLTKMGSIPESTLFEIHPAFQQALSIAQETLSTG